MRNLSTAPMQVGAPAVAVVLPVYNGAEHLAEAIDSVLAQSFADFELIVVDDCSTDGSMAIARSYDDSRVRVVQLTRNGGLAAALNAGIKSTLAPLIARQDQDDISHPLRLQRQVTLLDEHPQTIVVGTWARIISPASGGAWRVTGHHRHPVDHDELRLRLLWNNPFVHSSVVFRRDAFMEAGGYGDDSIETFPEDYDLWSRMAPLGDLANVGQELLTYRQTAGGMSDAQRVRIREGVVRIATRNLARATQRAVDDPMLIGLARVLNSVPTASVSPTVAWERVRAFRRASASVGANHSPRILAVRARWSGKVLIRSLDRRWGTLDEA